LEPRYQEVVHWLDDLQMMAAEARTYGMNGLADELTYAITQETITSPDM
jgi:hypothetical protein